MDNGRHSECNETPHSNCAACGGVILRREHHAHIFFRSPRHVDALCGECHLVTVHAATWVLQALQEAGFQVTSERLAWLIEHDMLGLLVQAQIPL